MDIFTGSIKGTPISLTQAKKFNTYTAVGWHLARWTTNNDSTFPQLVPGRVSYLLPESVTSGFKKVESVIGISKSQSKQKLIYESTGWDFATIWKIDEGQSYPYLWNESREVIPEPGPEPEPEPNPNPEPEPQPTEDAVFVKVDGVWHPQEAMYVKVDGAWKQVEAIMTKINGAWK